MTQVEVASLLDPAKVEEMKHFRNIIGNWWGVYHSATELVTPVAEFDSPFHEGRVCFRSRLIRHNYLWDDQAVSGRAAEIVLEQGHPDAPVASEEMAILVNTAHPNKQAVEQLLVMPDSSGHWTEPAFGGIDDKRDFYLTVLNELATR